MALASPSSSPSSLLRNPGRFSPSPSPSPLPPSLPFLARSRRARILSSSSPFTEVASPKRYERESWAYSAASAAASPRRGGAGYRDDEIALQLPELKKLLEALRAARSGGGGGGAGGGGGGGPGRVALVGTGPGDPELLTIKAVRAIEGADLILYDRLVSNDVLDLVRADARLLYVGKTAGYHSRTQEEIHELLLSFAEAGANVVRLKGGDPLVFGRGGEEMDFLQQQGINVEVIPGI
ncbi:Uroporphyrinogen-III C-methyltransferase [Ananas comosus]|uniref:uroporphyrinogen-III C-methyltransferase n=1 Tax=Ananas comosus TaxID=4615 RepID=A0A199VZ05_ANACO|nr:Uroporphyrinogen-III C-methyltransferase [Ananas comosus]